MSMSGDFRRTLDYFLNNEDKYLPKDKLETILNVWLECYQNACYGETEYAVYALGDVAVEYPQYSDEINEMIKKYK